MTESPTPSHCGQCGKPAIVLLNEHPLCVDCHYKLEQTYWMKFAKAATMANMADRDMVLITGIPHLSNQIYIPPPPIPPIHYNNQTVTVTGGTVGAINFGNVNDIQVNLQALTQNGEVGIADAMANLTNAILNAKDVPEAQKNELLEQVAFLTAQASVLPAERKPGMIKTIVSAVKDGAGAISSVAGAWGAVEPLLHGHFGL
jgi:hypothetical protein